MRNSGESVTQLVVLKYPSGHVLERAVTAKRELTLGEQIQLVGRRWRVGHVARPTRRDPVPRLLCTLVDAS